ncbi:hypothetical protein C0J52_11581 [Blattella germanica]|nr:hypothetical protein C0J52_11581 [Blattella germanica]
MINTWLLPELTARGIADIVTLQQDGAPPHFAVSVRTWLNELFLNRWIGRGSRDLPAPLPWPPRSPYLTTPDNALWGVIKDEKMNTRTWRRINLCLQHGGMHTDVVDK